MRWDRLTHEFAELIPTALQEGQLYVSIRYRTTVHLCACGCGNKVVTPIRPARWQLYFDGASVSLTPSIGNWQFPCRSHYVIKNNRVLRARSWTSEEALAGRARDETELRRDLDERGAKVQMPTQGQRTSPMSRRFRDRLFRRIIGGDAIPGIKPDEHQELPGPTFSSLDEPSP